MHIYGSARTDARSFNAVRVSDDGPGIVLNEACILFERGIAPVVAQVALVVVRFAEDMRIAQRRERKDGVEVAVTRWPHG